MANLEELSRQVQSIDKEYDAEHNPEDLLGIIATVAIDIAESLRAIRAEHPQSGAELAKNPQPTYGDPTPGTVAWIRYTDGDEPVNALAVYTPNGWYKMKYDPDEGPHFTYVYCADVIMFTSIDAIKAENAKMKADIEAWCFKRCQGLPKRSGGTECPNSCPLLEY